MQDKFFHDPHPGLLGALVPIPEPVRLVAADLAGKTMSVPEALSKIGAVTDGRVVDVPEHGHISLRIGGSDGSVHSFRVIRYR